MRPYVTDVCHCLLLLRSRGLRARCPRPQLVLSLSFALYVISCVFFLLCAVLRCPHIGLLLPLAPVIHLKYYILHCSACPPPRALGGEGWVCLRMTLRLRSSSHTAATALAVASTTASSPAPSLLVLCLCLCLCLLRGDVLLTAVSLFMCPPPLRLPCAAIHHAHIGLCSSSFARSRSFLHCLCCFICECSFSVAMTIVGFPSLCLLHAPGASGSSLVCECCLSPLSPLSPPLLL